MPTYDYECKNCKKVFEINQKMTDEPLKKCPKCGKPVKRLIGSGSGIIFKGSGFYATDYRKGSSSGSNSSSCSDTKSECKSCPHSKDK